jgi:hypothetical protein
MHGEKPGSKMYNLVLVLGSFKSLGFFKLEAKFINLKALAKVLTLKVQIIRIPPLKLQTL